MSRADGLLRVPSPQSSHIPYRDSKLTRILQESLGGNSRTTLIINCSPSLYNEAETLSTLRFGMRAKSIKNKARVNAELSPAELKSLLKRAQRDNANAGAYIGLLEQEVAVWREGGTVDKEKWASMERALGLGEGELEKLADAGGAAAKQKAQPRTPALDRVSEGGESRPETPSSAMGADEREEFIRRQNEMEDQIAKTVRRAPYQCFGKDYTFEGRADCPRSNRRAGVATLVAGEAHPRPARGAVVAQGVRDGRVDREQGHERRARRPATAARANPLRQQGGADHDRLAQGAERRARTRT